MDLFSDLQTEVQSDLNVNSSSSLFPLTLIKRAINRAYRKAGGLYLWPETEDAKTTTTQKNIEYYDYPQNWRTDSIYKLMVGTQDYGDPLSFKDFLYEKENNIPSGLNYMFANHGRQYFIYPTPTLAGLTITIWGQKVVEALVEDEDTTIFSYSMPECNEAIVLEAVAILKAKGEDETRGQFRSAEALRILTTAWDKIRKQQAKTERTTPLLDVTDFFAKTNSKNLIGRFDI